MQKSFLTILFFIISCIGLLYAQNIEEISIKHVSGKGYDNDSRKSEKLAIQNAKQNALNQAGISENIQAHKAFERAEIEGEYKELFTSNVFSELRGNVKNVKIIDKKSTLKDNVVETQVTINCTVLKYNTQPDPMFQVGVEGIKPFYQHKENLVFFVKPSKDCFLKAWMFTKNDAFRVFPNKHENSFLLHSNDTMRFPVNAVYELDSEGYDKQINRLIMVFMKHDYPYKGEISHKSISDWIVSLPPDQRRIKYYSFTIME